MRSVHHVVRDLAAAILFGAISVSATAAPDEIQVYTEEINDPGQFGLELHLNYALKGAKDPAFPGEMQSHHRLQTTPEFSYGLSRTLEAGLYLPVAMSSDGNLYGNGLRLRLKYIAPREEGARFFWGLNAELGNSARRISESAMSMELRPIFGYRGPLWLFSFNPILDADLSAGVSKEPKFEPALKVARKTGEHVHLGMEYYGGYGPMHHLLPAGEREHYVYGVLDLEIKGFDLNFGIGRGFNDATDKLVAKAIIAFPFN